METTESTSERHWHPTTTARDLKVGEGRAAELGDSEEVEEPRVVDPGVPRVPLARLQQLPRQRLHLPVARRRPYGRTWWH